MILALDPSSSAIGWAVVDGSGDPRNAIDSGVIRRPSSWPWTLRVRGMLEDLAPVFARDDWRVIVIEVPGPKQAKHGAKQRKGLTASTSGRYAVAVGCVLAECWRVAGPRVPVITVESDEWTRLGGTFGIRKSRRISELELLAPEYRRERDSGGDQADAIMMGCWWAQRYARCAAADWPLQVPAVSVGSGSTPFQHSSVAFAPGVELVRAGGRSSGSSRA